MRLGQGALQLRERRAFEIGQGRGGFGARGRLGERRRRGGVAASHEGRARHPGHAAVARRQGSLQAVHVAAQTVDLARGAQAVGLLKHRDGLVQGAAVARVVTVDGAWPVGLAVAAPGLAERGLHHRHVVTLPAAQNHSGKSSIRSPQPQTQPETSK